MLKVESVCSLMKITNKDYEKLIKAFHLNKRQTSASKNRIPLINREIYI